MWIRQPARFLLLLSLPLAVAARPAKVDQRAGLAGKVDNLVGVAGKLDNLIGLAGHVPDGALVRLAERGGLDRELAVRDIERLAEAGVSPEAVDRIVAAGREAPPTERVTYSVVDGVLRIRGAGPEEGDRDDLAMSHDDEWTRESPNEALMASSEEVGGEPKGMARSAGTGSAAPVIVDGGQGQPYVVSNGYPVGGFGPAMSAVFLPARFGDPPSSFGTTIVTTAPYQYGASVAWPGRWSGAVLVDGNGTSSHDGMIPIRTSRGTLWVPN